MHEWTLHVQTFSEAFKFFEGSVHNSSKPVWMQSFLQTHFLMGFQRKSLGTKSTAHVDEASGVSVRQIKARKNWKIKKWGIDEVQTRRGVYFHSHRTYNNMANKKHWGPQVSLGRVMWTDSSLITAAAQPSTPRLIPVLNKIIQMTNL